MCEESSLVAVLGALSKHLEASRTKLLAAVEGIGREAFLARRPGGASIRDLLVHLMDAEDYWIASVILRRKRAKYSPDDYEDVTVLRSGWDEVRGRTRLVFSELTTDLLMETRVLEWEEELAPSVGTILWHLFLHEAHHQGQICMMMKDMGLAPPELDLF